MFLDSVWHTSSFPAIVTPPPPPQRRCLALLKAAAKYGMAWLVIELTHTTTFSLLILPRYRSHPGGGGGMCVRGRRRLEVGLRIGLDFDIPNVGINSTNRHGAPPNLIPRASPDDQAIYAIAVNDPQQRHVHGGI